MNRRILKHSFSLLNVDHVRLDEKWNYKNVLSPYYRLYLIDEGLGYIYNEAESWALQPGYMYIIPSFTLCNLTCSDSLSQYFIHFFEDSLAGLSLFYNNRKVIKLKAGEEDINHFKRILQINPNRSINRSDNPTVYEKSMFYREYEELNHQQEEGCFLETQGILLQLLSRFINSESFYRRDAGLIPSKVVELMGFIELNLDQKITVIDLAKRVNLHPDYFSRLFLRLTGERPLSYIHNKRIERAQYLLTTSDASLSEVAEKMGFDTLPHFTKIFKKITRLTPSQYRNQNQSLTMF